MAKGVALDVDHLLSLRHLALRLDAPAGPPRSALPGETPHRRRGRGVEIHDVRPWVDGDDLRHLDRNVTARTGAPHVRAFREERERATLLVADLRPSMLFGTRRALRSHAGAEALALIGWRAAREGRVGLVALTHEGAQLLRYGRGARAMIAVCGALAAAHREALNAGARADPPLDAALDEADGLAGRGADFVLATGLDEEGARFAAVAEKIAAKRDFAALLMTDRFETAPPPGAYPFATLAGAAGWLDVGEAGVALPDAREARLRRLGVEAMTLDCGLAPDAMAARLRFFSSGRRRRRRSRVCARAA
ncbi:DUF58 domain-containing protein [Methylocella sp.]|uniref:DUF58 domain-containing protein n=1 Tax=Methylocella sp. TaxID=1978226 RepID=UPI003782D60C